MPYMWTNYVIGFGGERGSGKDTVAKLLKAQLESETYTLHGQEEPKNREVTLMGMSDILREAIFIMDPLIPIPSDFEFSVEAPTLEGARRYTYILFMLQEGGLDPDEAYTEAKRIPEVRLFLQRLGTEVVRDLIDTDAWVNAIQRRIEGELRKGRHVLVTGIRFPNELDMVRNVYSSLPNSLVTTTVYVDRDLNTGDAHLSETSLKREDFEIHVDNRGTLEQLETFTVPALRETLRVLGNSKQER